MEIKVRLRSRIGIKMSLRSHQVGQDADDYMKVPKTAPMITHLMALCYNITIEFMFALKL